MTTLYDSAVDLAAALRRPVVAYRRHDEDIGHPDPDRRSWYARCRVEEPSGLSRHASLPPST